MDVGNTTKQPPKIQLSIEKPEIIIINRNTEDKRMGIKKNRRRSKCYIYVS